MIGQGIGASIESYVPGRIRVRIPRDQRGSETAKDVASMLRDIAGIRGVDVNAVTGSVLVEYDPESIDVDQLIAMGKAANIIGDIESAAAGGIESPGFAPRSRAATRIVTGFQRFDDLVNRASRGLLDAKTLMPLLLLGVSLGRAFGKTKNAPAPWQSLMWYAYSMFMHWNSPMHGEEIVD